MCGPFSDPTICQLSSSTPSICRFSKHLRIYSSENRFANIKFFHQIAKLPMACTTVTRALRPESTAGGVPCCSLSYKAHPDPERESTSAHWHYFRISIPNSTEFAGTKSQPKIRENPSQKVTSFPKAGTCLRVLLSCLLMALATQGKRQG